MVIASIGTLLTGNAPDPEAPPAESTPPMVEGGPSGVEIAARSRLREAVLAGDERRIEQAIEVLFARMQPHAALIRETVISQRQARELSEAEALRAWIEEETQRRTEATRAKARALNRLLRGWFRNVTMKVQTRTVTITATRRQSRESIKPVQVSIDRIAWTRFAPRERRHTVR
jgi:hypothetical protein